MNVVNDKSDPVSPQPDPLRVITFSLFSGAAFSTFLAAALPLLAAQWRLPEPWPKVVALLGALVAVLVLSAPVPWVAVAFVLGMVFADQVTRGVGVWKSLALSVATAALVAGVLLLIHAQLKGVPPLQFWQSIAKAFVAEARASLQSGMQMNWDMFERLILYQAPFLLVGLCLISAWVSLGVAAHFQWLDPQGPVSAASLRAGVRVPTWLSLTACVFLLASLAVSLPYYLAGTARVLSCLLFVQGTVCLSDILHRRGIGFAARTWLYVFAMIFGFYALFALGVISPWYFRAAQLAGAGKVLEEKT